MFLNYKEKQPWKLDSSATSETKKFSRSIDSNRDRKSYMKKIKEWFVNKAEINSKRITL